MLQVQLKSKVYPKHLYSIIWQSNVTVPCIPPSIRYVHMSVHLFLSLSLCHTQTYIDKHICAHTYALPTHRKPSLDCRMQGHRSITIYIRGCQKINGFTIGLRFCCDIGTIQDHQDFLSSRPAEEIPVFESV